MMRPQDSVGMKTGAMITVKSYDPLWPEEFARVRRELVAVLPAWIVSLDHVGSTSVPNLEAKPIIDILVGVAELERGLELVPLLESRGFEYRPADDLPDRHFLPRSVDGLRRHHVSIAEPNSRHYRNTLVFRDALRGDRMLAQSYASLKRRLAGEAGSRRLAYLNGKTGFILQVLKEYGGVVDGDYRTQDLGSSAE